jgi:hypothetical protein
MGAPPADEELGLPPADLDELIEYIAYLHFAACALAL